MHCGFAKNREPVVLDLLAGKVTVCFPYQMLIVQQGMKLLAAKYLTVQDARELAATGIVTGWTVTCLRNDARMVWAFLQRPSANSSLGPVEGPGCMFSCCTSDYRLYSSTSTIGLIRFVCEALEPVDSDHS
jgi:hypothetical protein